MSGLPFFINRDPIQESGGVNLYGFCGNNGVNGYDVLGMHVDVLGVELDGMTQAQATAEQKNVSNYINSIYGNSHDAGTFCSGLSTMDSMMYSGQQDRSTAYMGMYDSGQTNAKGDPIYTWKNPNNPGGSDGIVDRYFGFDGNTLHVSGGQSGKKVMGAGVDDAGNQLVYWYDADGKITSTQQSWYTGNAPNSLADFATSPGDAAYLARTGPGGKLYQDQATRDGRLQGALARIAGNDPVMAAFLGLASPFGPLQFATYAQIYEQNVSSGDVVKLLGGYNDVSGFQSRGVMTINFMINGAMSDNFVESIAYHELTHALNHFAPSIGQPGEFYATSQQYGYEQKFFSSVGPYWASMGVLDRSGNFLSLPAYMGSQAAVSRGNPTGSTSLGANTVIIRNP